MPPPTIDLCDNSVYEERVIHPTAIISDKATIGENVEIGPYCVIGDDVTIGDGCVFKSHVVVGGHTTIGKHNTFFPFAAIGQKTQDLKYKEEPTYLIIGDHNVFRENTTIHRSTKPETPTTIGNHNLFLCYTHVAHDCIVHNHVIFSNNGTIAGHVEVEDHVIISGLAGVHQFCRVGAHSLIGGLSKVTSDVPPFTIVDGNPATVRSINIVGLERRGFTPEEIKAVKVAYRKLFLKKDANWAEAITSLEEHDAASNSRVQQMLDFVKSTERGVTR